MIRQIINHILDIIYVFVYKYKCKNICPFLLAVPRGEEPHKVRGEGSADIEFSFSLRVTERWHWGSGVFPHPSRAAGGKDTPQQVRDAQVV